MSLLRTKAPSQRFCRGLELQGRSRRPEGLFQAPVERAPASSFEARELVDQDVQPAMVVRAEIVDAPDTVSDAKGYASWHGELRRVEPLVRLRRSPER